MVESRPAWPKTSLSPAAKERSVCDLPVAKGCYSEAIPIGEIGQDRMNMAAETMRALVKREPREGIWMEEVPVPKVGMNEVLIKVEKTAICGTDLHIYKWDEWSQRTITPGLVIGHEFVGRILELGPGVTNYQLGDRVSAEGHITCG